MPDEETLESVSDPAVPDPVVPEPVGSTAADSEALVEAPEIAALKRERDEHYDRFLRKSAEFDNYRKRIDRERREQASQAVAGLLLELLLVVDDFDRALTVDGGEGAASYRKGVELIHAKLHDLIRKQGVRPIEAIGTDFDPNLHQAVVHEVSPEHREGEIIGELRRGYMLGERLLRPSMVKVAKP
jgi:molecular chaperone GrpE